MSSQENSEVEEEIKMEVDINDPESKSTHGEEEDDENTTTNDPDDSQSATSAEPAAAQFSKVINSSDFDDKINEDRSKPSDILPHFMTTGTMANGEAAGPKRGRKPKVAFAASTATTTDAADHRHSMTEQEEEDEEEITEESAIEFVQEEVEITGEEILVEVMEHFFLTYGGNSLEFNNWKKRAPQSSIVASIVQMFETAGQQSNFTDDLLHMLEASGRISNHSPPPPPPPPPPTVHTSLPSTHLSNSSVSNVASASASPIHHVNTTHQESPSSPSTLCESAAKAIAAAATTIITSASSAVATPTAPLAPTSPTVPVAAQSLAAPTTPTVAPAPRLPSRSGSMLEEPTGTREQIVEQAKQEAYVMQRIAELRKNGVWSIRRLPKVQEPHRNKVHWDYLLEEMQWLAADFLQERKWKRNSAKKCSKMVLKYHSLKGGQAERIEKEEQTKLRRIASNVAKMVKQFWSDIEKLMEHKQDVQLKEKRKKIHDMQLRFIVDKADHFTEKLAQEFVTPSLKNSRAPSVDSELLTEKSNDELDGADSKATEIVELLKKESEMPIEELADSLPKEFVESLALKRKREPDEHDEDDVEFEKGNSCSDDDEETIAKEEDQEANEPVDHKNELNDLQSDANIPIEELLSRYGYENETPQSDDKTDYTTAEDETDNNSDDSDDSDGEEVENADIGIDYLVGTNNDAANVSNQDGESDSKGEITEAIAAAAAESIQPKGNTLSSVEVITKVPKLLKFQLREYQHIGLDWLVAMYEKNLNGILADEMGLGKTIQTISLIAHLACEKGIWGPHLIVVPTSVMLNWEMEFKKWCPALKILTYYGNPKERRIKRKGWTKPNTFHVCITSYKLVVQDHSSFRRKKWVYFILDEAQHIKNFKSQRWQMLLNFNSTRRLLLTGTPLQNNLMELWSLMHFLMPNVFQSHREFKDWFVNPVTGMIEGNQENEEIIRRLHKILRPFLLRRLKCDVEKQLPKKYEHIVPCSLSKRQRQLYDEYMSMGKTQETLASGNFLSVINILMQLRKVCNHPNLFDPRPTVSPFIDQEIVYCIPSLVSSILDYQPLSQIDLQTLNLIFLHLSTTLTHPNQRTLNKLQYNSVQMERAWNSDPQIYARVSDHTAFHRMVKGLKGQIPNKYPFTFVIADPSALMRQNRSDSTFKVICNNNSQRAILANAKLKNEPTTSASQSGAGAATSERKLQFDTGSNKIDLPEKIPKEGTLGVGKYAKKETITRIAELKKDKLRQLSLVNKRRCSLTAFYTKDCIRFMNIAKIDDNKDNGTDKFTGGYSPSLFAVGSGFSQCFLSQTSLGDHRNSTTSLIEMLHTPETLEDALRQTLNRFLCIVPNVISSTVKLSVTHLPSYKKIDESNFVQDLSQQLSPSFFDVTAIPRIQLRFQLPELRLIQYDCGKLQVLDQLLWRLKSGKHRVLIFTQMSRMLDIFEQFLNYHGHTYLRLDGSTRIEQRQALMERFNADQRIFCFILSTRSGGVGVNLTGADTVIFYDSDWNPTMDAQAQDRCHRIGQTRDVHIYRLVSERTVEENILRKAQQKKLLGDLAIEEGNFTTAFFKQAAIKDLFEVDQTSDSANNNSTVVVSNTQVDESPSVTANESNPESAAATTSNLRNAFEQALCTAEEDTDVAAAKEVRAEAAAEFMEFDENIPIEEVSEEKSPEEEQVEKAISQLMPVERYALKYFESQQDFQELKQAEEEIEETKKQWQKSIKEWRQNHDESRRKALTEYQDSIITSTREDSVEKVFMSINGLEPMPIWAPPTPPQDENDLYIDYSLGFLYEKTLMPESQLPPIYIPKEHKRLRVDVTLPHGRKHLQSSHTTNAQVHPPSHAGPLNTKTSRRTDDLYTIPKSPFDRSTSLIIRFRRELLIMKTKLWPGSSNLISSIQRTFSQMGSSVIPPSNIASMQSLAKTNFNTKLYPRWLIHEEFSIIMVLIYLQDLPYNLSIICPGHIPNWDLVAEQVNTYNSFKRSTKFCKFHFESVLAAKNDSNHMNDNDTPKTPLQNHLLNAKQSKSNKKSKNQSQSVLNQHQTSSFMSSNSQSITLNPSMPMIGASLSTPVMPGKGLLNSSLVSANSLPSPAQPLYRMSNILQNMVSDNNMEFTNEMNKRFDAIKQIVISKTQTSKSRFIKKHQPKTFDHVSLLMSEYDIKYDKPLSVVEVAAIRAERISKDKQAAREQQAREAREINQIKAFIQGNTSTPPTFHTSSAMSSPSVMSNIGVAANSSTHHLQQQQQQQQQPSAPQILSGHIQQQSQSQQQSPQVLINQVPASTGQSTTTFISAPQLQHVLTQSKKMQSSQSPASIIGSSQRILTSSASSGQLIASTVPSSIIATNKGGNQPIITRTIRADLASQLHGNVTVVPSSMASSFAHTTAVPDPGNQLRQIQLLQKRPTPQIQVSSTGSHQQVLMHKTIVQQSGGTHSIVVSSDGQQSHSSNSASANIISPMLQSSNSGTISKNTFHLVPATIVQQQQQQQSSPTVNKMSREQQAREAREINQIKAFIQGNTSTPPTFHTSSAMSSVMSNIGVVTNSSTHLQQQQQQQQQQSSPQILMSNVAGHIQQQSQSQQQSPQVLINQVPASSGQSFISAPQLQHVLTQSKKMQSSQSPASIIGSSQRILTSSASSGQLIASSVPGSIITTNKGGNQPIITRTIRADLASQLHGNVTVVSSSIPSPPSSSSSSAVTAVPIPGNHLRQIQLLQKRPTPQIQVSSTGSHQQVLMHKTIVQQSGGTHSIVVSSDGQQSHSSNSASANIISPMLQSSNSGTISKNTFHLVPATIVQQQQQSSPITVTKTVLASSPAMAQQVQQALKQGQIIMQQQAQNSGQVAQTANSPQVKTSAGQHFIAVSSNDSQSSIPVNATTIKLLPTSAALAIQQQQQQGQQSISATTSLPQSIATPKGHIIISGHAAAAGASSHITSSALLQQVVSNQSSSNSGQTLTFAIRTAHGQQLPVQPQPGTVHLGALTLKTPTSVSAPHGNPLTTSLATTSGSTTTQQSSALVAALSQSTPPLSSDSFLNATTSTNSANSTLLRTLASNVPSKAIPIPIVLMQSSQNASLISQSTPSSVSLLNTVSSSASRSPMNAAGNKITTSTQTAGNSALGSILNSAVKVPPSETQFVHMPGTPSVSSRLPESPLIEALMSPIGKLPRSSMMMSTPQPKPDESRSEADN